MGENYDKTVAMRRCLLRGRFAEKERGRAVSVLLAMLRAWELTRKPSLIENLLRKTVTIVQRNFSGQGRPQEMMRSRRSLRRPLEEISKSKDLQKQAAPSAA